MKSAYIKPEMELLDSNLNVILCVSTDTDYNTTGEGGGTVPGIGGGGTPPKPSGAREFGSGFEEDDEF